MRVLITGAAGFIGSNLADYLLCLGHRVIGIDDLSYGVFSQIPSNVDFHQLDIRSENIFPLFNGVDTVFHLAAKNSVCDCKLDPVATTDINVVGTTNVFEASCQSKVPLVVYAESAAIYENVNIYPTPETKESPQSYYAVSKYCNALFAKAYNRFYGMNTVGLRYFNIYGARQDYRKQIPPVMSAFIIKLLQGERPLIYGDGSKLRDFLHVDDLNAFHSLLMQSRLEGHHTFNVGSGVNYSVSQIYSLIEEILQTGITPIYRPDMPGEAETSLADISKAKSLGWEPKIDIHQGLRRSIEYIKSTAL